MEEIIRAEHLSKSYDHLIAVVAGFSSAKKFHEYSSGKLHEVTEQVKRELYEAEKIEEIIEVLGAGGNTV